MFPDWISRPKPLITPVVNVWSKPKGFPIAYTRWPTIRSEDVPMGRGRASAPVRFVVIAGGGAFAGVPYLPMATATGFS